MKQAPLQIGILGLGEGVSILSAACQSTLAEPRLLCDLDEDLCKARCRAFGLDHYTTSYGTMLADPEVECIAIYTPDALHATHAIAALEAGKHVICTKPLIKGLRDGAELFRAVQTSGKQLLVGQSCRFFPTFLRQKQEAGDLGEIISAEAHYHGDKRGGTSGKWGKGGGADWLYTGMSHPTDLVYSHLGPIESVCGMASPSPVARARGDTMPDNFHFALRAKSGAIGQVSGCFGAPPSHPEAEAAIACTLRGANGVSHANYPDFRYFRACDGESPVCYDSRPEHGYYFRWGGSAHHAGEFQNYLEYFARCIREGEPARPDVADGLRVIATLEAMARATKENRVVRPDDLLKENGLAELAG